jgi:hypothetical protein
MGYTAMGDYDGVDNNDPSVEVKTNKLSNNNSKAASDSNGVTQSGGKNVLHNYRLFNYVFTFSALKSNALGNPDIYSKSANELVIIKSGGKGENAVMKPTNALQSQSTGLPPMTKSAQEVAATMPSANTKMAAIGNDASLIAGFNERSPGRFDMFIDNVEIESVLSFGESGSTSQPTKISFDVVEPYSINGFIEALHVSAVAAGYPSYNGASFILKMEFIGYPDNKEFSSPESVDFADRFFPVKIAGVEVSVDERGTKYRVTAIPFNEAAFGNPSQLKKSVKMSGKTVQEILQNLMDGVNKQIKDDADATRKTKQSADSYDEYRIKFPVLDEKLGRIDTAVNNIGKAEVSELLKDNTLYKFPDPGSNSKPTANQPKGQTNPTPEQNAKSPETYKLEPSNPVVQFAEGRNINECITSIIRDSKYVRNIMEKLSSESEWKTVVKDNMVDYFLVKIEVTNKPQIDDDKSRPYQIFTYVVTPYKMLYTLIPGYGRQQLDMVNLKKVSIREYNYIYTGKNVDITRFALKFDTLFFEAIPAALGNNKTPGSRDAAGKANSNDPKSSPADPKRSTSTGGLPQAPIQTDANLTANPKDKGNQRQDDPYSSLALGLHNAVVNSKANMISGEIEILGDPIYVVTGGIGNINHKPGNAGSQTTDQGEAAHNNGQVLITINFRNPIDIDPLEQGGRLSFDSKLVPFSGVYSITTVKSTFKDGMFKQVLNIIRVPGQAEPTDTPSNKGKDAPTDPTKSRSQASDAYDTVSADTTPAEPTPSNPVISTDVGVTGSRASTLNLATQLDRGLPSPGLPGVLSNFTAATGGLGGTVALNQVSGATNNLVGNTRIATQIFGGVVPGGQSQFASGIPMSATAASVFQQRVLSPASLITQIGNTVSQSFGLKGPAGQLVNQIVNIATTKINRSGVIGSGIGAGATIALGALQNTDNPTTYTDYRSQQTATPPNVIATTGIAAGLDKNTLAAVASLGGGANLVNNVGGNTLASLKGTATDPMAIAGQFGVNAAQLSGLSPNIQSKILDQVSSIASNVPANTSLSSAAAQGVNLQSMSSAGLARLPPTAPYSVASGPAPDTGYLNQVAAQGGAAALARAYGVNNINDVPQDRLPSQVVNEALAGNTQFQNPLTASLPANPIDSLVNGAKYLVSNTQLSQISGLFGTKEGQLQQVLNRYPGSPINVVVGSGLGNSVTSKFGSKTTGQSPLDKIMLR